MPEIDELSIRLLEQAKRFLERAGESADGDSRGPYLHAALLLGFCALEAHLNAVAEELALRSGLGLQERSILLERDIELKGGRFVVGEKLKIYRLEDRLGYIFVTFTSVAKPFSEPWWGELKAGLELRNRLVHPKTGVHVTERSVSRSLQAILDCLDALYRGIYKKRYPSYRRGLASHLHF